MLTAEEEGFKQVLLNPHQRLYLEELIKMDVAQIAADIASAETGSRPMDALHLRLALQEASGVLRLVALPQKLEEAAIA